MDLDGDWKPPEQWPESSPPLPGWIRKSDGLWMAPTAPEVNPTSSTRPPIVEAPRVSGTANSPTPPSFEATKRPARDAKPAAKPNPGEAIDGGLGLRYASEDHVAGGNYYNQLEDQRRRRAVTAALTAALVATMLGAGIVLLILL